MSLGQSVALGGQETYKPNGVRKALDDGPVDIAPALREDANIYERILHAATLIPRLEKDGVHKDKQGQKELYKYVTVDQIVSESKKALASAGVYAHHEIDRNSFQQPAQNMVRMWVKTTFVNVRKPDDILVYESIGEGTDYGDKAATKAYSIGVKQNLAKALGINTFEDAETLQVDRAPDPEQQRAAEDVTATAVASWQSNVLEEINKADSVGDLRRIARDHSYFLKPAAEGGAKDIPQGVKDRVRASLTDKRMELEGGDNAS